MAGALFLRDAKKESHEEGKAFGLAKGIAKQKAEDEKRIASQAAEIAELKAQFSKLTQDKSNS